MHTLRFSFLVLIAVVFASSTKAQDNPAVSAHHPNIFLEFGGNGGILSLNYDRRFSEGNNGFGARVGVGLAAVPAGHIGFGFTVSVPLAVNYLLGKGPHQLEAGAGITVSGEKFSPSGERVSPIFFVPSLGYRFHRSNRRSVLRIFVCPFIAQKTEISGGLSFGVRF